MRPAAPSVAARMAAAAELRAAGATWDAVGRALACHADTCRKWSVRYAADWRRLLSAARLALREDSEAEARTTLRSLLRSEDESLRRDAAKAILAHSEPATTERVTNDAGRIEEFLAELDEPESQTLDSALDAVEPIAPRDSQCSA